MLRSYYIILFLFGGDVDNLSLGVSTFKTAEVEWIDILYFPMIFLKVKMPFIILGSTCFSKCLQGFPQKMILFALCIRFY